ncbi:ubiquitin carboxyl-terminal hydrolase 23-like [Cornus florida]|uniref:ubiquitin carboxyl-terminal hydrolase 23-like n=1 Tax=Cornus florida TaxID=4283 RepID=UPI00289ED7B3|nr:ubiquitin carboxyl-terminal hydrolase 23-like [Cornus florida]
MANTLITASESNTQADGFLDSPAPSSNGSLFHRRIEFHLARKPFTGFSNGGGDFRLETLNPNSEPQRPGQNQDGDPLALAGKKSDGFEFSETGLDPELSFRITFRRIGAGLENLGNTCFLNSVLQCLTYTEPLAAYLQSGKHQISCRTAGFCALCAIQKHVSRALQATGRILAPKDLVSNLRCVSRNFRNARQEDAHEYMVNLLESMHKCSLPSGVPSESPGAYKKSLVHKIFGGRLCSQVKCMQCSFCSNKFDPFLDLSLEIAKADSLYKALAHFTAKEQLDGGERQYQCQKCKQKVKAIKQLTVYEAPYVLAFHLKRFGSYVSGQKIDKKVEFGPTFDLKPFVTGPYDGDLKYTLYGVLVHAGWSTHSGHYYCFVRTSSGMWYYLDDNKVVQVNERKVLEQKAYMLFYFRDRKNFAPKKPVNIVQKDNLPMNAIGNKAHSSSSKNLKEMIHNIPIEKKLNGAVSSASVDQRGALNACAAKVTMEKEASVQKINGPMMTECNKDTSLESSTNLLPLKDPEKELPVLNLSGGDCLPTSAPSVRGYRETLKLDKAMITTTAGEVSDSNHDRSTKKDLNNSVASPPNYSGHHNPYTKRDLTDSVAMPPNSNEDRSTKKDLSGSVAIPSNCNGTYLSAGDICITEETQSQKSDNNASLRDPSKKNFLVRSLNLTGNEDSRTGGGFPKQSAVSGPRSEKDGDIGQRMVDTRAVELSSLLTTTAISLLRKAVDSNPPKKIKKKLLKCQIKSVHLGSNILFGASLSLRKKNSHKRSKRRHLKVKNLTQNHFLDVNCFPADLGPSTSEKARTICLAGSTPPRRKKMKSRSNMRDDGAVVKNDANCYGDISMSLVDEEFRKTVGHCGNMLATDEQPKKYSSSASVGIQWDARGTNGSNDSRRDTTQNAFTSMLTRGVEETVVARWDGIELPRHQITGSSNPKNASIGYVADEWDEEYDRGKRKKIRSSKNDFSGPNLFQEIASKKAKLNKAKMDQSSSGNRPFRI